MDIEKIEKRLKRINTVLEAFKEDNKISSIEKDLLLGYLRELYQLIRDSEADSLEIGSDVIVKPPKQIEPIAHVDVKEIIFEKVIEVQKISSEDVKPDETVKEITIQPKKVTAEEIKRSEPPLEEEKQKISINAGVSPELESIFVKEEIMDLADKLSMMKINDIAQSIGINSRLVMINELFNGDSNLFNATIKKLNGCSNFEEAKFIMINEVALPLNWEKDDKLKEAQQLVKLVMRKFS
jgi:hypothetical protein